MPDEPISERARRRLALAFALAALVYVALRVLIVVTAFDQVALWMYETYPIGTIAEIRIRGLDFPLRFFYDNAAGQILSGLATVPAFLACGSTYLALKLVPFLLGVATFALLYVFLKRHFGARAAVLGAWLFALAPTTVVKYSVIASGNHFENLFFTLLAVAAFYRLHDDPERRGRLFAAGFAAGLALFVFLGALIPVGLLAGMHVGLRGLRRTARDLAFALPGFALGILPLVVLNATTGGRGLGFLSAKFGEENARRGEPTLERALAFLTDHLPAAGVFEPFAGFSPATLGLVFLGCFLVAYALSLADAARGLGALARGLFRPPATQDEERAAFERAKLVPFVLYLPLAALAYGLSNFRIGGHAWPIEVAGYRYFLPHFLFATVLIAAVAARACARGGAARVVGLALVILPLAVGLSSWTLVDFRFARANLGARYEGFDLSKLARGLLSSRNGLSQDEIVARVAGFPRLVRFRVLRAIGFNNGTVHVERLAATERRAAAADPAGIISVEWRVEPAAIVAGYPAEWHAEILRGVGTALRFDVAMDARPAFYLLGPLARSGCTDRDRSDDTDDACRALAEGAAQQNPSLPLESQSAGVLSGNHELIETCLRGEPSKGPAIVELAASLARGHGALCGNLAVRGIESDLVHVRTAAAMLPEALRPSFCYGLGLGCAEGAERPFVPPLVREIAAGGDERYVWMGIGGGLRRIDGDAGRALVDELAASLPTGHAAALEAGFSGMVPRPD